MRTATVIASILAELQKFFDVQVPCFQIGTHGAFTFASLVYRDRRIVYDFEEGPASLRFTVCSLDVRAKGSNRSPIVTKATSPLGQHGVISNCAVDAVEIVDTVVRKQDDNCDRNVPELNNVGVELIKSNDERSP